MNISTHSPTVTRPSHEPRSAAKKWRRLSAAMLSGLLVAASNNASADTLFYLWGGSVVLDSIPGVLTGDTVTLSILFDPIPQDSDPSASRGHYDVGADGGMLLTIDRGLLDPIEVTCLGGGLVIALDDPVDGDSIAVRGETCFDSAFRPVDFVGALLNDPTGLALTADALPLDLEPPMFLEKEIVLDLGGLRGTMLATVTTMLEVPEPTGGALTALLALGVLTLGRRRHV